MIRRMYAQKELEGYKHSKVNCSSIWVVDFLNAFLCCPFPILHLTNYYYFFNQKKKKPLSFERQCLEYTLREE